MDVYHQIWLDHHPDRSKEWLSARLQDGFGIHHIDGDHNNNSPENLILLEWLDHKMLHNGGKRPIAPTGSKTIRAGIPTMKPTEITIGRKAYEMRARGAAWKQIQKLLHLSNAVAVARKYAIYNAMIWPLPNEPILPPPTRQPRKRRNKPQPKNPTYYWPAGTPRHLTK